MVKLLPPIQSFGWIFLIISPTCFCQKTARSKTFPTSILCSHSCKTSQTVLFASISPFYELSLYLLAISPTLSINNIPFYNAIYITRFIYLAFSTRLNFFLMHLLQHLVQSDQIRSVTQSCPTLCDPMNRSTPGLPVHHQLPEFIQTHVHRVSDAIQPSHPLSSPSLALNPSQHQNLFQ